MKPTHIIHDYKSNKNILVVTYPNVINNTLLTIYDFTGVKRCHDSQVYDALTKLIWMTTQGLMSNLYGLDLTFYKEKTTKSGDIRYKDDRLKEFEQFRKEHPHRVVYKPNKEPIYVIDKPVPEFRKEVLSDTPKELFDMYRSGIILNSLGINIFGDTRNLAPQYRD